MENNRLIMYHKQSASARIMFFALNGSVCHFDGLPPKSKIVDSSISEERVVDKSENLITISQGKLGLSSNILEIEKQFLAIAKNEALTFNVYLASFTTVDPPYEQLADLGGKFITLIEARSLPSVEIELLGLAYSFLMD
ncbi:conserved hypothetical protein [Hyella patelloides LEGE 07179]|uniref:Uncharacterized protein n=1 Tax=Hyella patelloides LEGE 07179 TaxID=945734 RepID=A0A563VKN5_9CYAN|nr:hypothetical protein [Hyella patelloides]VEP11971.1 conserved hypothetical protein [Hyella patelloides LEGE 07179]